MRIIRMEQQFAVRLLREASCAELFHQPPFTLGMEQSFDPDTAREDLFVVQIRQGDGSFGKSTVCDPKAVYTV